MHLHAASISLLNSIMSNISLDPCAIFRCMRGSIWMPTVWGLEYAHMIDGLRCHVVILHNCGGRPEFIIQALVHRCNDPDHLGSFSRGCRGHGNQACPKMGEYLRAPSTCFEA